MISTFMRKHVRLLALTILFALLMIPTVPVYGSQTIQVPNSSVSGYAKTHTWSYRSYSVERFSDSETPAFRFPLFANALVDQGYLALSSQNSLWLYNTQTERLYNMRAKLPTKEYWYQAGTDAYVAIVDNKILTQNGGDYYLLNPATREKELWISASIRDTKLGGLPWYTSVRDGNLYVHGGKYSQEGQKKYRVTAPNMFAEVADLPEENTLEPTPDTVVYRYLNTTDKHNSTYVGLVEEGVYVATNSSLTKVGYTSYTPNQSFSEESAAITRKSPRFISAEQVGWIGADGAFYTADWSGKALEDSGLLDMPHDTPFRSMTSPHVYYHTTHYQYAGGATMGTYRFDSEEDYFHLMNTKNFNDVLWLPNEAVDTRFINQHIQETNARTGAQYRPLRDIIYDMNRMDTVTYDAHSL